jgi:hypothetical protein
VVKPDLVDVAHRVPDATLSLVAALARLGLTDRIRPPSMSRSPVADAHPRLTGPVSRHHFARETFSLGRESLLVGPDERIGIDNPERCVIDSFRLRHGEGASVAVEALRAWLRCRGSRPAALMVMAKGFPQASAPLRKTLEVVL